MSEAGAKTWKPERVGQLLAFLGDEVILDFGDGLEGRKRETKWGKIIEVNGHGDGSIVLDLGNGKCHGRVIIDFDQIHSVQRKEALQ